ncbi:MAG: hypothetical protein HY286_12580 [Planctomycetes bacterium]|nr:hypothetical protein [Planctomycetota bacterium]
MAFSLSGTGGSAVQISADDTVSLIPNQEYKVVEPGAQTLQLTDEPARTEQIVNHVRPLALRAAPTARNARTLQLASAELRLASAEKLLKNPDGRLSPSLVDFVRDVAAGLCPLDVDACSESIAALPLGELVVEEFLISNIALRDGCSEEVRVFAGRAVAANASDRTLEDVAALLSDSTTNNGVRWALAQGLKLSREPGAHAILESWMREQANPNIQKLIDSPVVAPRKHKE